MICLTLALHRVNMNTYQSPAYNPQPTSPQSLTVRSSKLDPNFTVIHPAGVPDTSPPLYSLSMSTSSKPNVVVYRGPHSPSNIIGNAVFHSLSGRIDLTLHGQLITMTTSSIPYGHHFDFPPVGKLKWQPNQVTGMGLELRDASGMKLVKLKSAGLFSRERVFETLVPCDPRFMDLVVLSGWAIRAQADRDNAVVGDVLGAVLGG